MDESGEIGQSSLVLVDPPVIQRIKGTLHTLMTIAQQGDGNVARMAFLFDTIGEEIVDEMAEYDETTMRVYLAQIGQIISWIGHGDNSALPEGLRGFAEMVTPTVKPPVTEPETEDKPDDEEKPEPEVAPEPRELSA